MNAMERHLALRYWGLRVTFFVRSSVPRASGGGCRAGSMRERFLCMNAGGQVLGGGF